MSIAIISSIAIRAGGVSITESNSDINTSSCVGNSDQLYRLISNLILNGIQYTPKGGNVTVFFDKIDYYALIRVEDTGIGIPENQLPRIFDRFYRVNRDRSRSTGGFGLGLAIAQAIVTGHQGKLHVESQLASGSIFTVQLPINAAFHQKRL